MKQAIGNTQISTEGTQIRLERYFNAPRERVFARIRHHFTR